MVEPANELRGLKQAIVADRWQPSAAVTFNPKEANRLGYGSRIPQRLNNVAASRLLRLPASLDGGSQHPLKLPQIL